MIKQLVEVSVTHRARHSWPDAPKHRAYLAEDHLHTFRVTATFRVKHGDRDREFHDLQAELDARVYLMTIPEPGEDPSFGHLSCEGIASELLLRLKDCVMVRVEEDPYCAGIAQLDESIQLRDALQDLGEQAKQAKLNPIKLDGPTYSVEDFFGEPVIAEVHDVGECHRPEIVTVCGSTRFADETRKVIADLEREGVAVFSVGFFAHAEGVELSIQEKAELDVLHLRKIDLSDAIFVVNPGGYVGESTMREIVYAESLGKEIHWLETPGGECDD